MIALLLAVAPLATAEARDANPIPALAGAYHEPGGWAQIIPVDARHAYVHLYFEGGIGHDLMTEFEEVMTVKGRTLTFRKAASGDSRGCLLTVRRAGRKLAWAAPEHLPCSENSNLHFPLFYVNGGTMDMASRRPASRTRRYPGEGWGYLETVAEWRKAGRR
ncbi:hypothetical protein PIB19_21275 [Sphingomonas sp. 7/4-4]|uniref:hypothetical protein n=1 Tax=Sphingomonas sp. 7/4-4 TaxID=3018446 RepID=UPI0022F3D658|nr:hypothetical protein [Sphingomonas sp. 7/4-4]WBY07777.1 hypothetical protein PIB19_21275 [Sphingomonas sp. 7/4-4]